VSRSMGSKVLDSRLHGFRFQVSGVRMCMSET
jgi:hypothetical protein